MTGKVPDRARAAVSSSLFAFPSLAQSGTVAVGNLGYDVDARKAIGRAVYNVETRSAIS